MFTNLQSRTRAAFTLVEMSMAIAISGLILTVVLSFSVYAAKTFAAMYNYVDLEQMSQTAVDSMLKDVRQTRALSSYGTTTLNGRTITNTLNFLDFDNQPLTYQFTNNCLFKTKGGVTDMMLTNVEYLCFQVFMRAPTGNNFDQFPIANNANALATAKVISVSWICSRSILGSKLNTESVQTAKIVIRKQ